MAEDTHYFSKGKSIKEIRIFWAQEYRSKRYLRDQSAEQLKDRLNDIIQNLYIFDDETGKYKFNVNIGDDKIYRPVRRIDWLKILSECKEELKLKKVNAPEVISLKPTLECERILSKASWANRPDLIEASKSSLGEYEIPRFVFRYSKKKYNKQFVDLGRVRLKPASSYNDDCLLRAQRDDETAMEVNASGGSYQTDDFLTVCLSGVYSYRMYCEFEANSCVVIQDVEKFMRRFSRAVRTYNKNSHGLRIAQAVTCPTIYYDPFNIESPTKVDEIFLGKPFRFAYQHEFRIVVLPTKPQPLAPLFLDLGPLSDITELVCDN